MTVHGTMNWAELDSEFANSGVNSHTGRLVVRTERALTVLVSLQPIGAYYGSDDTDVRDQ